MTDPEKEPILRVRMDADLKHQFFRICKGIDRIPSQMVRDMIRQFVREHAQGDLLVDAKRKRK